MTPDAIQSTLPLSKEDILCFTRNFLPYQAYLGSISTLSLTMTCPHIFNLFISSYVLKFYLHDHDSYEVILHLNLFQNNRKHWVLRNLDFKTPNNIRLKYFTLVGSIPKLHYSSPCSIIHKIQFLL